MAELLSQLPSDLDVENMVATALTADKKVIAPAVDDPRGLLLKAAEMGSNIIDNNNDDASSLADSDIN